MNQSQYEEQLKRVSQYEKLSNSIDRLEEEKEVIKAGILSINCQYYNIVDCDSRYKGFHENLQNALVEFYDSEIERLRKLMEKI